MPAGFIQASGCMGMPAKATGAHRHICALAILTKGPSMGPRKIPALPYAGRLAALSTMHQKERAIAPVMRQTCSMVLTVPTGLDTDALGTFSGEIPRAGSMLEAATAKARLAMEATGLPVGLASEGSYGPHPDLPWVPAGLELLVLVDDTRGLVIAEQIIDDAPVFFHAVTSSPSAIADYLARIGFGRNGVIVKPNDGKAQPVKGIVRHDLLAEAIRQCAAASADGKALVQTDMRAHMNTRRMEILGGLARRLARRLNSLCPACHAPGFGVVVSGPGLACAWCGEPTTVASGHIQGCAACHYRDFIPRRDGQARADPRHCLHCNP